MRNVLPRWSVFTAACVYTVVIRLLPYALRGLGFEIDPTLMTWPWNFSPALALGLYGAATLPQRGLSLAAPVMVNLLGDLGIWALTGHADWAFYPGQWAVYVALVLCAMLGWVLRTHRNWAVVGTCAVVAPWLFFLLTNAACWIGNVRYPQSLAGLMECYTAAWPFHKNLMYSTLVFSVVLFSPLGVRSIAREDLPQPVPVV